MDNVMQKDSDKELSELRSRCAHLQKMVNDAEKARKDEYELRLEYLKKHSNAEKQCEAMANELREANKKVSSLTDANKDLQSTVVSLREKIVVLTDSVNKARREVIRLNNRSFFARLFNR